jgi:hypothetical protein
MTLLSAEPGDQDMVPREHREALRTEGRVVADTWVGFFRWHGSPVLMNGQGVAGNPASGEPPLHGYSSLLAFEGLGFYITAFNERLPAGKSLSGDRPPMLSFLPQRTGMIDWPPPQTDNRMLRALLNWTPLRG